MRRARPEDALQRAVAFTVEGLPIGKGRARVTSRGTYTPKKTRDWERRVRDAALLAMRGRSAFVGPITVEATVYLPVPASWSGRRKAAALAGQEMPAKKPDIDNLLKACLDAMQPLVRYHRNMPRALSMPLPCVFRDDSQVVDLIARKRYGEPARVELRVAEIGPAVERAAA